GAAEGGRGAGRGGLGGGGSAGSAGRAGGALMLVDANLLLYAVGRQSRFHAAAAEWLTEQLNGSRRVGLPWQSLVAFARISTHPRASARPLAPGEALRHIQDWLTPDVAWTPAPRPHHGALLADLIDP